MKHSHLSNGSQLISWTVYFFFSWKTHFPKMFSLKIVFFLFFLFEFNILINKIPETKHSHLWNSSQLTLQTVHFYSPAHFIFVWWKLYFPFKIVAKLSFFNFFTFEFNIFNDNIPEMKHSHLSNNSQISQNDHFCSFNFCLMKIIFPCQNSWKTMFVLLISNENDLFFTCNKSSNTIKKSLVKVSFAKMKMFRFNLHAIVFHT